MPGCVSDANLHLESGLGKVEARSRNSIVSVNTWQKLNHTSKDLASLILQDNFQSSWLKIVLQKLMWMGSLPPSQCLGSGSRPGKSCDKTETDQP